MDLYNRILAIIDVQYKGAGTNIYIDIIFY